MKVAIHTLGCKVNSYESESMEQLLVAAGYEIVEFDGECAADVYIINTCSVTNIADRKSRQMLHRAKKLNPKAIVVAVGCYVNADSERVLNDSSVDLVIGNNQKINIVTAIENYIRDNEQNEYVYDMSHLDDYENLFISDVSEHTRAYIKIQDGCNQFCTYCIIPYTRGRIRSRDLEDILSEVKMLAAKGYKEYVLTGINLSSYEDARTSASLLDVILAINAIEGVRRIRLGSLEPRVITEDFIKALSGLDKFCRHFHLSLQSGCDTVLARMNRKYSADEYYASCCLIRSYMPDAAITTDIIVGFPQETDEEFEATVAYAAKVNLAETHVFKYSRRKGTVADGMKGQVPEQIKDSRSQRLIEVTDRLRVGFVEGFIGKTLGVLVEKLACEDGTSYAYGFTHNYIRVKFACDDNSKINTEVLVTLKEIGEDCVVLADLEDVSC